MLVGNPVEERADNEHADLFRALKGGANRFGIVTRYEVQAAHVGQEDDKVWWGGMISVSDSNNYVEVKPI